MRDVLYLVESLLPQLLADASGWNSLLVDYHAPIVERVWRQWDACRISLHCIHPCDAGEALYHPHPWPAAMRICSGQYEMAVGYGEGDDPPPVASTLVLEAGSCYEMINLDGWHAVRPLAHPVLSVMVSGAPWDRECPKSTEPLVPLSQQRVQQMLHEFSRIYGSVAC